MNERFMFRTPYFIDGKFIGYIFWKNRAGLCPEPPQDSTYGDDEQCTGLKDKNGTLIYEGDIVKADSHEPNHHAHYWNDKPQVVGFAGCAFRLRESYLSIINFSDNRLEIIGNIHTNKGETNE